jgi:5,6-dimethylbenzimidazole synthase
VKHESDFTREEREGVYKAIYRRRDIRKEFLPDPIPDRLLSELIRAAHHAPSVGFMQPWDLILIKSPSVKGELHRIAEKERRAAACIFEEPRAAHFLRLKVEALREAPIVLCIAVDPTRGGPHVLGRNSDEGTALYSACCAVQNLWLAARAEGIGMGWVTIYKKADLRRVLGLPPHLDPIGLLCLGYVEKFPERPMLEAEGWAKRLAVSDVLHFEKWGKRNSRSWRAFLDEAGKTRRGKE